MTDERLLRVALATALISHPGSHPVWNRYNPRPFFCEDR